MEEMTPCDCDGCEMEQPCIRRWRRVSFGEKVFCQDGTVHLVDETSLA